MTAITSLTILPTKYTRALTQDIIADEDDIIGEVSSKVISIIQQFAGFVSEEIMRIFQNKSKSIKLYWLRQLLDHWFDTI